MIEKVAPVAADDVTPRLHRVVTVQYATLLWLREQIAAGTFKPGVQLRQEILAKEFGFPSSTSPTSPGCGARSATWSGPIARATSLS
jgi:hypothetical protein